MEKQQKPRNPWWAYMSHVVIWFLSGGLLVLAMSAIESEVWIMAGVGLAGCGFLVWAAQVAARQFGYVKAIHEAYMEDQRKRQGETDAKHQEH